MSGASIFVIVFFVLIIIIVLQAIKIVPQGWNYTVERFGRYTRTLEPGLGMIVPLIDRIGHKMNMMERVFDVPTQEVITKDNAMVEVDGVAFFQVLDAPRAAYEVEQMEHAIKNVTMTSWAQWILMNFCPSATKSTKNCSKWLIGQPSPGA